MASVQKKIINNNLILTIYDPSTKNAFSPTMAEEFFDSFNAENFSGILLKAKESIFCSGGNLSFYKKLNSKEMGLRYNERITEILTAFEKLPVPKVCIVNGLCVGGGVELISAFDKVFATPQSLFGLWQRRVGLTFGWGGQKRLLKRMSKKALENWLLEAATLSAYQAKDLGVIDQIGLASSLELEALSWLEDIQKQGKKSLSEICLRPEEQDQVFKKLWMGEEHKKALSKVSD